MSARLMMASHFPRKVIPLSAIKLSLDDVAAIYHRLATEVNDQAERQLSLLQKGAQQTDEEFEAFKKTAREQAFKVTITLTGRDGETVYGDDANIFTSAVRPDKLNGIFMTNTSAYQAFAKNVPVNSFELNLDFSKPPLLDATNAVSAPTVNLSNLTVQGDKDAWVAAIQEAVFKTTHQRQTKRGWMHRGFVYDLGLFLIALPFALYWCWKVSPFVGRTLGPIHPFLSGAAYVYVVFTVLFAYRAFFGYAKWAFPTMELSDNKDAANTHRAVWATIAVTLIGDVIWEVIR